MNRKGFTLIELIATLAVLGIVMGITIVSVSGIFSSTKKKSEDVFVETIKDAMEMYLTSSNARTLSFGILCSNTLNKTHGNVKIYKATTTTTFNSVINSEYKPITESDLVNPANEDVACNTSASVAIYRDEDYVYYYSFDKDSFGCLTNKGVVSNLPEGFVC